MPTPQPRPACVRLGDHLTRLNEDQEPSGRDEPASDVMHADVQRLEKHQAKIKALETALIEGEQSGQPRPIDFEAFKARMRAEYSTPA